MRGTLEGCLALRGNMNLALCLMPPIPASTLHTRPDCVVTCSLHADIAQDMLQFMEAESKLPTKWSAACVMSSRGCDAVHQSWSGEVKWEVSCHGEGTCNMCSRHACLPATGSRQASEAHRPPQSLAQQCILLPAPFEARPACSCQPTACSQRKGLGCYQSAQKVVCNSPEGHDAI